MTDHDQPSPDDLGRRLDAAMGSGPALPSPAQRVARGRSALRRRRVVQGVAALAAAAVVGSGATWAAGLGDDSAIDAAGSRSVRADPCPVLPSMTTADAAALPEVEPTYQNLDNNPNEPASYDDTDGSFGYQPGVRGIEHLTGALSRPGSPETRWDAVEVEIAQGTYYELTTFTRDLEDGGGGGSLSFDEVTPQRPSLAQWAAFQLVVRPGSTQDVLALDDSGALAAREGVEIQQQTRATDVDGFSRNVAVRFAQLRLGPYTCYAIADTITYRSVEDPATTTFRLIAPEYVDGATLADLARTASDVLGDD